MRRHIVHAYPNRVLSRGLRAGDAHTLIRSSTQIWARRSVADERHAGQSFQPGE